MYFYYYSRQYLTTHEPRHVQPPFVRVQFRVGRAPALRTQPFSINLHEPDLDPHDRTGVKHRPCAAHAACPLPPTLPLSPSSKKRASHLRLSLTSCQWSPLLVGKQAS